MVTGLLQQCRGVNVGDSHSVAFPNFRLFRVDAQGLQIKSHGSLRGSPKTESR